MAKKAAPKKHPKPRKTVKAANVPTGMPAVNDEGVVIPSA
jgi:hypothetical protein